MGAFDDLIAKVARPPAGAIPAFRDGGEAAAGSGLFDDLIAKHRPPAQEPQMRGQVATRAPEMPMPSQHVNAGLKAVLGDRLGEAAGYIPGIAVGNAWVDAAAREKMNPEQRSAPTQMLEGFENVMRGAGQRTNPNAQPEQQALGEAFQDAGGAMMFQTPDGRGELVNPDHHVVLKDPNSGKLVAYSRSKQSNEMGITGASRVITQGLLAGPVTGPARATSLAGPAAGAAQAERAATAVDDMAAFERSRVPMFSPAFSSGPVRGAAKSLADTPYIGAPLNNALDRSIQGTADAVDDVAGKLGSKPNPQQAGTAVRDGLERFKDARPSDVVEDGIRQLDDRRIAEIIQSPTAETSFKTKQGALYERAWRLIPEEMQKGRAVEGQARFMSAPSATRDVLEAIVARNTRMVNASKGEAPPIAGGQLGRMIDAIRNPKWRANLQTLRDMRSEVRRLASGMADTEKNVLKTSDLDRIQGAITRDMIGQLQANAAKYREAGAFAEADKIERSIKEFSRADQFTRLSIERMDKIERLFKADTGEALARNISSAALDGGRGNIEMLQTLRKTLRPDEMGEVRSMLLSELGKPSGSVRGTAQEIGFNVNSFVTRWNNMSPAARDMLFGGEHRKAIEDIVTVAKRLSNVDAMGNVSRSGTHAVNVGGILALGGSIFSGSFAPAAGGAATAAGLSYLLSRPAYARWTASYLQMRANLAKAPQHVTANIATHINRLAQLAKQDPALEPIYRSLAEENGVGQRSDAKDQNNQRVRSTEQREQGQPGQQ